MNLHTATIIATLAHHRQVDKGGKPYIEHPTRVSEAVPDDCKVVAMLHDVVEDTWVTMEQLIEWGLTNKQSFNLAYLTHIPSTPYENYIQLIASNRIARTVKIADLRDNMRLDRLEHVTAKDLERHDKYTKALHLLTML